MTYIITTQITSFDQIDWINVQTLIGEKVTKLYCTKNQITSFQHLPNSVTELYCEYNQITSFQHLPNSVNQITSIKDLLYIPLNFLCDINITPDDIYKNKVKHNLDKINKIVKNKQATRIKKIWEKY